MPLFKNVNGAQIQMTAGEEALYLTERQAILDAKAARDALPPPRISQFQFRAALRAMNRAAAFRTYVLTLNANGQEFWATAKFIYRTDPEVAAAQAAMTLTDTQVDNVFKAAGAIPDR